MPVGKLLGKGTYGCVYDTEFKCAVSNEPEYASKVTIDNEALALEVKYSKMLYKAEKKAGVKKGTYFIGVERPCKLIYSEYVRHNVKKCEASKVKAMIDKGKTNKLVVVFTPKLNGGDYTKFEWKDLSITDIWGVWLHLWKGLDLMHSEAGLLAYDIKQNNIMMSEELKPKYAKIYGKYLDKKSLNRIKQVEGKDVVNYVPKFIDFGLSKKINMKPKEIEAMVTSYKTWSEAVKKSNQGKMFSRDISRDNLYKNFKKAKNNKDLETFMKSIDIFALAKMILRPLIIIENGKKSILKDEAATNMYIKALEGCPNVLKLLNKCMDPDYSERPSTQQIIKYLRKNIKTNTK